jgi:hypothetical protein
VAAIIGLTNGNQFGLFGNSFDASAEHVAKLDVPIVISRPQLGKPLRAAGAA